MKKTVAITSNTSIEDKLSKVSNLVDKKEFFEEKRKGHELQAIDESSHSLEDNRQVFQKKLINERLKSNVFSTLANIKLGKNERKIKQNQNKINKINSELQLISDRAKSKNEALDNKRLMIENQLSSIELINEEITSIKNKIEAITQEFNAKEKVSLNNKKDENQLKNTLYKLNESYEAKLNEISVISNSLEWQNNFIKEKHNEKLDTINQIEDVEIQMNQHIEKVSNLKEEGVIAQASLDMASKDLSDKNGELQIVQNRQSSEQSLLDETNVELSQAKAKLVQLSADELGVEKEIEFISEKIQLCKNDIFNIELQEKEFNYKTKEKEQELENRGHELNTFEASLSEKKYLLESKTKKYGLAKTSVELINDNINTIQKKGEDFSSRIEAIDVDLSKLEQGRDEGKIRGNHLQSELVRLTEELESKKLDLEVIKGDVLVMTSKNEDLVHRIDSTRKNCLVNEAAYEEVLIQKNTVVESIKESQFELIENGKVLKQAKLNLSEIEKEKITIELSLESINSKIKIIFENNEQLESKRVIISTETINLKQELSKLELEKQHLLDQVDGVQNSITELTAQFSKTKNESTGIENDIDSLGKLLAKIKSREVILLSDFDSIRHKTDTATKKRDTLQQKYDFVVNSNNEVESQILKSKKVFSDISSEQRSLESSISHLEKVHGQDLKKLEASNIELEENKRKLLLVKTDVEGVNDKCMLVNSELESSLEQFKEQELKLSNTNELFESVNNKIIDAKASIKASRTKVEKNELAIQKVERDVSRSKLELTAQESSIKKSKDQVALSAQELKCKKLELELIKKKSVDIEDQKVSVDEKKQIIKSNLELTNESINDRLMVNDAKGKLVKEALNEFNNLSKLNLSSIQRMEGIEADISHADNQIDFFHREEQGQREKEAFLKRDAEKMESILKHKQEKISLLENQLKTKVDRVNSVDAQLLAHKKNLAYLNKREVLLEQKVLETSIQSKSIELSNLPVSHQFVNCLDNFKKLYPKLTILSVDQAAKKYIVTEFKKVELILEILVRFIPNIEMVKIASNHGVPFVQFEGDIVNENTFFMDEFKKSFETSFGVGQFNLIGPQIVNSRISGSMILSRNAKTISLPKAPSLEV